MQGRLFVYMILVVLVLGLIIHSYWKALLHADDAAPTYSLVVEPNKAAVQEDKTLSVTELLSFLKSDTTSKNSSAAVVESQEKSSVVRVCTVATNKRQGSIFRTNLLSKFGSGKYTYVVRGPGKCGWNVPRIRMIPYVKCCMTPQHVRGVITKSIQVYDVIIITGDEYCKLDDPRAHFRQYHGDQMMSKGREVAVDRIEGPVRFPLFIPLGPRSEFERVAPSEVMPAQGRKYIFNFVGSLTSSSRRRLKAILTNNKMLKAMQDQQKSFIHITGNWKPTITVEGGFITPQDYRKVLLNSIFTLCPIGHNPEAYRIYEACEAGSIPVLTIDSTVYNEHLCKNSYKPFVDAKAPFVFLKDWTELDPLIRRTQNITWVKDKQMEVRQWYQRYMENFAIQLEAVMDWRFRKRLARSRLNQTAEDALTRDELIEEDNIRLNKTLKKL